MIIICVITSIFSEVLRGYKDVLFREKDKKISPRANLPGGIKLETGDKLN